MPEQEYQIKFGENVVKISASLAAMFRVVKALKEDGFDTQVRKKQKTGWSCWQSTL